MGRSSLPFEIMLKYRHAESHSQLPNFLACLNLNSDSEVV